MARKPDLAELATEIMRVGGLEPDFSKDEVEQLSHINSPASIPQDCIDLRKLLWCSIDNDDSRDLDQLTYGEKGPDQKFTIWIAVADVSALVPKDSPIDIHAQKNTTSVYTPAKIFPMLPEKLSTNLSSLNENEDRLAMVVKIQINETGNIEDASIFQAVVHNYAKLTYSAIGAWLEEKGALPETAKKVSGLENVLRTQHEVAQILRKLRHEAGSLTLESSTPEVKIYNQKIQIELPPHNFAHQLIEEFMIAANRSMAKKFKDEKITSLRRVVRIPKYWDRIVEIAKGFKENLPKNPDSKALDQFLIKRQEADPVSFPDLSLTVIKLLGSGEYIVENATDAPVGHFGLALSNYTHSTAANRRFPDLISQRQYKAFLRSEKPPYSNEELYSLASQCTKQEDAATKIERELNKSAAAELLSDQIGHLFSGIITGASERGTWVRIFKPAVEGKIIQAFDGLKVGDLVTVRLKNVNVLKGFIDFINLR
jgi:VacB/RNase II family 3'-5' exoribonuclease